MDKELKAIHGKQTAKVLAILTFVLIAVILVPVAVIMLIAGAATGGREGAKLIGMGVIYLIMPIIYFPLMYVLIRLYSWIYNKVAARFGGIRFTLEDLS